MALWERVRGLLRSNDELASADRHRLAEDIGADAIGSCVDRSRVTVRGTIDVLTVSPRQDTPWLEAELSDGTGRVTLIWMGRHEIAGIEAGETTADGKFSLEMVSCLGVCGVVWANSGTRVGAANIQSELPASADKHQELSALISTMLRVYQNGGPGALERFFPLSPEERELMRAESGIDPVEKSLEVLRKQGRRIALEDVRCYEASDSKRTFFVTGSLNGEQKIKIGLRKFPQGYGILGITEL